MVSKIDIKTKTKTKTKTTAKIKTKPSKDKKVSLKEYARRREIWLKALESGRYKQCSGVLTDTVDGKKRHCCLGVACRVVGKEIGIKETETVFGTILYADQRSIMPAALAKYLGLNGTGAEGTCVPLRQAIFTGDVHSQIMSTMAALNDNGKWSFKQIAKYIRENPSQVYVPGTYRPNK